MAPGKRVLRRAVRLTGIFAAGTYDNQESPGCIIDGKYSEAVWLPATPAILNRHWSLKFSRYNQE